MQSIFEQNWHFVTFVSHHLTIIEPTNVISLAKINHGSILQPLEVVAVESLLMKPAIIVHYNGKYNLYSQSLFCVDK